MHTKRILDKNPTNDQFSREIFSSALVPPTIFVHKSPIPATRRSSLSFSLSRGISRGKRRVESDSRKRNSLAERNSLARECIRFSSPFSPFFSFLFFTDRSIIRQIVSMDRRSPEILLDVSNRFQSRLLFPFFVSRKERVAKK